MHFPLRLFSLSAKRSKTISLTVSFLGGRRSKLPQWLITSKSPTRAHRVNFITSYLPSFLQPRLPSYHNLLHHQRNYEDPSLRFTNLLSSLNSSISLSYSRYLNIILTATPLNLLNPPHQQPWKVSKLILTVASISNAHCFNQAQWQ